jgi:hypothetical protein
MTGSEHAIIPPDWVSKTLATLDAISGYTYTALAFAGGLILFLPSPMFGIDLSPIRAQWSAWIGVGVIVFAALAIGKLVRTIHGTVASAWAIHKMQRGQKKRKAEVLAHLDTLSEDEKRLLSNCLADNRRSVIGNYLDAPLVRLPSKGIFEIPTQISRPQQEWRTPFLFLFELNCNCVRINFLQKIQTNGASDQDTLGWRDDFCKS